jgi:hypothetical protein
VGLVRRLSGACAGTARARQAATAAPASAASIRRSFRTRSPRARMVCTGFPCGGPDAVQEGRHHLVVVHWCNSSLSGVNSSRSAAIALALCALTVPGAMPSTSAVLHVSRSR